MEKRGITKEFDEKEKELPIVDYKEDSIVKLSKRVVKQIKKASNDNANISGITKRR